MKEKEPFTPEEINLYINGDKQKDYFYKDGVITFNSMPLNPGDIIMLDNKGNVLGQPIYDRWNETKWYQKVLGFIYPPYKRKFVDMKGFEILYSDTNDYCDENGKCK